MYALFKLQVKHFIMSIIELYMLIIIVMNILHYNFVNTCYIIAQTHSPSESSLSTLSNPAVERAIPSKILACTYTVVNQILASSPGSLIFSTLHER